MGRETKGRGRQTVTLPPLPPRRFPRRITSKGEGWALWRPQGTCSPGRWPPGRGAQVALADREPRVAMADRVYAPPKIFFASSPAGEYPVRASGDEGELDGTSGDEGELGGASGDEGELDGTSGDEGELGGASGDEGKLDETNFRGRSGSANYRERSGSAKLDRVSGGRGELDGASGDNGEMDGTSGEEDELDGTSGDEDKLDWTNSRGCPESADSLGRWRGAGTGGRSGRAELDGSR